MKKSITYLGKEYKNIKEFCEAYNLNYFSVTRKLRLGQSVEEIFNPPKKTDHLGNSFDTIKKMCAYHNVGYNTYLTRRKRGLSKKEALTGKFTSKKRGNSKVPVVDFQGIKHESTTAMCNYYGVKYNTFRQNILRGKTEKEALTIKGYYNPTTDHLGNKYNSVAEMCRAYDIDPITYRSRINKGYSIKDALTFKKYEMKQVYDHLGNAYPSEKEMAKTYGLKEYTFRARKRRGYDLEKALTTSLNTKVSTNYGKKSIDHLGNEYKSIKAMCDAYNISVYTFKYRLKHGYSLKRALTK